jgi:hypothetical protein
MRSFYLPRYAFLLLHSLRFTIYPPSLGSSLTSQLNPRVESPVQFSLGYFNQKGQMRDLFAVSKGAEISAFFGCFFC